MNCGIPSVGNPNLDIALAYVRKGFTVIPCKPDKRPYIKAWPNSGTTDDETVRRWWQTYPDAVTALPCGPNRLFVVDCDRKEGGLDGVATFEARCRDAQINLSKWFTVETPNRGRHYYFRAPDTPLGNTAGKLGEGIDSRGIGGYVIAPGSVLPDGREYRVLQGTLGTAPLPEAILTFLVRQKGISGVAADATPENRAPVSRRERVYAAQALADEATKLSAMASNRNHALNSAAFAMGQLVAAGWIERGEVEPPLWEASRTNGYRDKDGDAAARATLDSGLASGMENPRQALPESDQPIIDLSSFTVNGKLFCAATAQTRRNWPKPLADIAMTGLSGEFVRLIGPHSEGDPAALLVGFLVAMGTVLGRSVHLRIGASCHFPNLFAVIVATSSKGRKGTVMAEVRRFVELADPSFVSRIASGLSSGEGLIEAVRDPLEADVSIKENGRVRLERQIVDNGIEDKRLLAAEGEMAQPLQAAGRDGNTLSAILRQAWDGTSLRVLARSNKNACKEPHISILGNITEEELRRLLTSNDRANGFGNRFLWCCASRSKHLPFGGSVDLASLHSLAMNAASVIERMRSNGGAFGWTDEAARHWRKVYPTLSAGHSGLFGAMTARAEAQTVRIALIYAALDEANRIDMPHLSAALEVWRYCEDSVRAIFGDVSGDEIADAIIALLRNSPDGLSETEFNHHFQGHKRSADIKHALTLLQQRGSVRSEKRETDGRPRIVWFLVA